MLIDRITAPLLWGRAAHDQALANARAAATDLSRRRVEREEVDLFLAERYPSTPVGSRPA